MSRYFSAPLADVTIRIPETHGRLIVRRRYHMGLVHMTIISITPYSIVRTGTASVRRGDQVVKVPSYYHYTRKGLVRMPRQVGERTS